MKALQDRVNIVPVIAKADTLTSQELARFKKNVGAESNLRGRFWKITIFLKKFSFFLGNFASPQKSFFQV
jgi:septin family protein